MKKVLLAGTALVGAAVLSTPAHADLKLDLGGYFRGYAVYSDNDEVNGSDDQQVEFRRDTEVHFTGETTTDSGLTVGVHSELKLGGSSAFGQNQGNISAYTNGTTNSSTDEAYAYFSGGWGRVNFGSEDGAAYLLQVAAPSADSNIDGLRVYEQSWDQAAWIGGANPGNAGFTQTILGYDNADFKNADRLTYLTPKWNGFQAGLSYAPNATQDDIFSATNSPAQNNNVLFDDIWEASARWDGEFQGFGISVGGGYSMANAEQAVGGGTAVGSDDLKTWDAGLNVSYQDFSLGVAYKTTNEGIDTDGDLDTWVVGAAWDNGPYHVGASWADFRGDNNTLALGTGTDSVDLDRYTIGGGYTYGPGMTFRGSVAYLNVDSPATTAASSQYQVALGTDINF
ncbi:MAG: porin [Micavibrio sp.]|nr:porin [Micavibrio sp.]